VDAAGRSGPVPVRIRDFQFEPKHLVVRRGQVLEVANDGDIAHNLTIERGSNPRTLGKALAGTGSFLPGRRVRLAVDLPAGHTYTIACTIPGHRDLGLFGTLRVR
jgi:plastocyanin